MARMARMARTREAARTPRTQWAARTPQAARTLGQAARTPRTARTRAGGTDAAGGARGTDAADGRGAEGAADDSGGGGDGPAATIRAYYRALDARRFDAAWRFLAPGVRSSFGGIDTWRAGFATTRSSRPGGLHVAGAGDRATVEHALTATDATTCGTGVRRFALTWTLLREPQGAWRATAVTGRLLSGGLPVCP